MTEEKKSIRDIPFSGKLITSLDPLQIKENFSELKNLRYTETSLRAVGGMTKINPTTALGYPKARSGIYFKKDLPVESHIVIQVYDSDSSDSKIVTNDTAIPSQGDFSTTTLFAEAAGTAVGSFSKTNSNMIVYCNGVDTLLWGGNCIPIASCLVDTDAETGIEFDVTNDIKSTDSSGFTVTNADVLQYLYIGSTLPLKGFNFVVSTANTTASTMDLEYYKVTNGWTNVSSLVDGTNVAGKQFAQSGQVTFTDTLSTAQYTAVDNVFLFWYRINFAAAGLSTNTKITHINGIASMQQIKDIWDGDDRVCANCFGSGETANSATKVLNEDYISGITTTYFPCQGTQGTFGFLEPMMGINFTLATPNSSSVTATWQYWDGSSFTALSNVVDRTLTPGSSTSPFSVSGNVSWDSPTTETPYCINNSIPLYWYRVSTNSGMTGLYIDYVGGVPRPIPIGSYKFPLFAQNRLWLCSNQNEEKNSLIVSAADTIQVFNGKDSEVFTFGDGTELTAGTIIYAQYGSNVYDIVIIFKQNETFIITGTSSENWIKIRASSTIGCVAPKTLITCNIDADVIPGLNKNIAIWQASDGIYLFDGKVFILISNDIGNLFLSTSTDKINVAYKNISTGFFDIPFQEYHWLFASGTSTTLNRELVFSLQSQKWFEIDRGTGEYLQLGINLNDTTGNNYIYGFIDTGYAERLENGTTFDGNAISCSVKFGDMLLSDNLFRETTIRAFKLSAIAKTGGPVITVTHYGDSSSTGTSFSLNSTATNRLIFNGTTCNFSQYLTHSFKFTCSSSDQAIVFEPLLFSLMVDNNGINKV
jgi:hypothetical protein